MFCIERVEFVYFNFCNSKIKLHVPYWSSHMQNKNRWEIFQTGFIDGG